MDSESLTFSGGTGIDTSGSGNTVTFAVDATVATLTGTQTLTNKSIDASQLTGTVANARLDQQLQDVAGLAVTDGNFIVGDGANFVAESGATARTSLGLGSIATQDANNVSITGGSVSGITDLAIADGGTAASTASAARSNLGVAIGTDVQAYDAGLTSIAGLTTAADKIIYTTASDTYAVTDFTAFGRSLVDDADASAARTTLGVVIGTDVQAYDAQLADVAGLTPADGSFIVGDGANFVAESGATARTSLGLGTAATQDVGTSANNVVQLDGTGKLPAVDGSQLTNINFTEQDPSALAFAIALG